jgi:signal transduction histidine kinase
MGSKTSKIYKNFTFDAGAVVALGRDSIKDNTTAIVELVKNSYDADASKVLVEIVTEGEGYIRVSDSGTGMTEGEIDDHWLRIGFSEKRENKKSKRNRRKTGEKGIGRLSAYRLGNKLKITTRSVEDQLVSMLVNWKDFEQPHVDAEKVKILLLENELLIGPDQKVNPGSGTELFISDLRQHWSKSDMDELYRELENLSPPFKKSSSSFKIILKNDVFPELNGTIHAPENKTPRVELQAKYDGKGRLSYKIFEPKKIRSKVEPRLVDSGDLKREQLVAVKGQIDIWETFVGPFSITLRFYLQASEYLNLVDISGSALRDYLEINSGIKIYRDGIRVKPYGDSEHPDGDWLGLESRRSRDPAGAGRSSFKVANRQLVGGVFISRDENTGLLDSSSREGLQNGDEFHELKLLMTGCITLLESHYHQSFLKSQKKKREESDKSKYDINENVGDIVRQVADISSSVKALVKEAPQLSDEIQDIVQRAEFIQESARGIQGEVEQLASQATIYRGLATIGITTAVFGHETQSSIGQLLLSLKAANVLLPKDADTRLAEEEIDKAIDSSETISAWGKFALSRVNRDKRKKKKVNLKNLIQQVAGEMTPLFSASGVELNLSLEHVEGKYFAMDVESIVMNLLSNAYFACKLKSNKRRIEITLMAKKAEGREIPVLTISDTGPGVPKALTKQIFEPLFTTKRDAKGKDVGTGLGLSIVRSILDDISGDIRIDKDPALKGARFTVFLG